MKKTLSFLVIFVLILIVHKANAETEIIPPISPPETIVLKFADNSCAEWKESARKVEAKVGMVKWIPCDKTKKGSELICIQYIGLIDYKEQINNSVEKAVDLIFDRILSSYPSNLVTLQIIEKNPNDILYEWTLNEGYKDTPPQYEISRAFITEHGFHRIAYTCDNSEITPDKRDEWVKLLKDSVSVVSFKEAVNFSELSMRKKFKTIESFNLGPMFSQWQVELNIPYGNGRVHVAGSLPSSRTDSMDALEIITLPNFNANSLSSLFKVGCKLFQNKCKKKIKFNVLQTSPTEIFYCYSHRFDPPLDRIILNAVVRSMLTEHDHYLIVYKCILNENEKFRQKDIIYWKEQLEKIKLCNET